MNRHEQLQTQSYMGAEYMELVAEDNQVPFLLDCYASFGWKLHDYSLQHREYGHNTVEKRGNIVLPLKRDRSIMNKTELVRLQRNFEACLQEVHRLELRKTSKATALALIIGFLGGVCTLGAVLAITSTPPHMVWGILLAVPAFIGIALPYPIYRRVASDERVQVEPLIAQKYDEIHAICQRADKLSYGTQDE